MRSKFNIIIKTRFKGTQCFNVFLCHKSYKQVICIGGKDMCILMIPE